MIAFTAQYYGKLGSGATVGSALERMVAQVKEFEPGCKEFRVCRALDNPDDWLLYEEYTDQDAIVAHTLTDHFQEIILGEVAPLLIRQELRTYEVMER